MNRMLASLSMALSANPDSLPSLSYDLDSGLSSFQDDVFENQLRVPGSDWPTSKLFWTDVTGEEAQSKEDIMCPAGWEWTDIWTVDLNRAVDEEGYEYCLDQSVGGFVPVEKTYHLCRRRRWVRTRKRNPDLRQQAAHVSFFIYFPHHNFR